MREVVRNKKVGKILQARIGLMIRLQRKLPNPGPHPPTKQQFLIL